MNSTQCPDLEVLFGELADGSGAALKHASICEHCHAIIEEHRQLEKDLYRLVDPPPPATFVHQVMARVAAAPAPVRSELKVGLPIFALALGLAIAVLAFGGGLGSVGTLTASALVAAQYLTLAASKALSALWTVAPAGTTLTLFTVTTGALLMLRWLAGGVTRFSEAKIYS
jgi:hypothetical protein